MPRKGQPRDVNLDCPAVKLYREIVHLQLNYLQRQYVVDNISCCERGLRIWRATLTEMMVNGYNPRRLPFMVKIWTNQFFCDPCMRFTQWQPNANGATHD